MRKLFPLGILAVFAFLFPSRSQAAGGSVPMFTYQAAVSSITTAIVSVSTSAQPGATQMDNPQLFSRVGIEIQNIDATANLWCLAISTTPTTNNARKIAAGNSWVVSIVDTLYQISYSTVTNSVTTATVPAKFWCLSDGAAATKAAVTQLF